MTQVGVVTLLVMMFGQVISSWMQVHQLKVQLGEISRGIAKENANRRMQLEDKVDDLYRFFDRLRVRLWKAVDDGEIVIPDRSKLDMDMFIPPPRPKYNGNDK